MILKLQNFEKCIKFIFLLISEIVQEFTAQIYLRQTWVDERLTFEPPPGSKGSINVRYNNY
jgi:hypothetical protein